MTMDRWNRFWACLGLTVAVIAACRSTPKYAEPPRESYATMSTTVDLGGSQTTISGASVARDFFRGTGVPPFLGRTFLADDHSGGVRVVVVSEAFWRNSLGGEPTVIGRQIKVNGDPVVVVGAMPRFFDSPPGTSLWLPRTEPTRK